MIHPIIRKVDYLKEKGIVRKEIDSSVAGYFLMGMGVYNASLIHQGTYSMEEIDELTTSILENGLLK